MMDAHLVCRCVSRVRDLLRPDCAADLRTLEAYCAGFATRIDLECSHLHAWSSCQDAHDMGREWFRTSHYLAASALAYAIGYVLAPHPEVARIALIDARGARARAVCGDASDQGWDSAEYSRQIDIERDAQNALFRRRAA